MIRRSAITVIWIWLCIVGIDATAFAQIDEARQAMDRGEYVAAINILTAEVANRPTADAYLYLGMAYANTKEYDKAEKVFKEGDARYSSDPRFNNELAGVYLANDDVDQARSSLNRALQIDPGNNYASDLLATLNMSEGNVQAALRFWNKSNRPVIDDILHNYYLSFGSWVVRKSVAFRPAGVLRYQAWKTTEARLFETDNYTNVGLEVEPTIVPDRYNAVVRTSAKTNTLTDVLFSLIKGAPLKTSYLDLWNLGNSGVNFNAMYRWHPDRRRIEGSFKMPLPIAGILFTEVRETWRYEHWNLSPVIRAESLGRAQFRYKSNGLQIKFKHIPHYRVEIGGGFEYVNRAASGDLPELFTDSRNTGKILFETNLRLADGRYQNRLRFEGFVARKAILGDFNYSGGTVALNNRLALTQDSRTFLDITVKGGTSRGKLPVEDYFVLGMDTNPQNLLRGHSISDHGQNGRGPMGTDFVLANIDLERRIVTLPIFNTLNLPYLTFKWEAFLDGAKTFDRARIFQQSKLLVDAGGGLRIEAPATSFTVGYGRSLRDGKGIFFGYVERRLW
jgi:tetratricopeptide (TPR) repeat protein